uniref:Uncharacterized protein n=1 Tax=Alexandrium catenella TaxID=2925 RepID=A0A7S1WT77_ALECA
MTKEADRMEARRTELDAELEALTAGTEEEEARADEAEQKLTADSATSLAEYAAKHEQTTGLEKEAADTRAALDAQRSGNLGRSRQSIELDREDNACVQEINEAEALLEKCSRSHGELDAEIERRRGACEEVRQAHRRHADRLEADLQRFAKSKVRLFEVYDASGPSVEAESLMKQNDAIIADFRGAWEECQQVIRNGIEPKGCTPAPAGDAAPQAARPRRWRTQPAVDVANPAAAAGGAMEQSAAEAAPEDAPGEAVASVELCGTSAAVSAEGTAGEA